MRLFFWAAGNTPAAQILDMELIWLALIGLSFCMGFCIGGFATYLFVTTMKTHHPVETSSFKRPKEINIEDMAVRVEEKPKVIMRRQLDAPEEIIPAAILKPPRASALGTKVDSGKDDKQQDK